MIEKVGNKDVLVRDYTSNFNVKEFIQDVLVPKAFPDIPMNKLNLGYTGVTSEMISQAIEDSYGTATLMMNEAFITRAELPSSIYSSASLFNLGYSFAVPSKCHFGLQLWLPDVIKYSTRVTGTNTMRYVLDKNTRVILGDNIYRLDYDVIIDHQVIDGKRVFQVHYDMSEPNSISFVKNKYVKHQVTSINWLVLFIDMREFERKVITSTIADNLVTTNSDITLKWNRQIAGVDLVYITPRGERQIMKLKTQYTKPEIDPFAWYKFHNDNTMKLSFTSNKGYFAPAFNSKVEATIYVCRGATANFDSYDRKTGVPVQKTGERFAYNSSTRMVALCYGASSGGLDKGDIELLRDDVIMAYNTVNVLTTDHDLQLWFNRHAKRYNTKSVCFKRRDDPSGKLFSQFVAITEDNYVYPTNTLTINVNSSQCDYANTDANGVESEFVICPGHLWEYDDKDGVVSRDTVRMVNGNDGPAMVTDDALPAINTERPFMFVNPFYIKIHRDPTVSASYNCLINHTSWPVDVYVNPDCFYQFQLATFSVERSLTKKLNKKYRLQVICVPTVTTDKTMKYIEGVGEDFPEYENNLRMVLITRNNLDGETGYIEMKPVEVRNGGSILYEAEIAVHDNIRSDMMIEVDMENTPGMHSLITNGPRLGKVFVDPAETSFHFAIMMKDTSGKLTTNLFNDESFKGYVITNRFANDHRDLTLYKPMTMMRSTITFTGENGNYDIKASLTPLLKWDVPFDDARMAYFIRAFGEQYTAMEPVLSRLDGNSSLDFKLYNSYGRSNNYYIGPKDGEDSLRSSDILLDNVYVSIKFRMAVFDRSIYNQTVSAVINEIKTFFDSLNVGSTNDIHVSDLIHRIIQNHPNVNYIRFLGFNDYDARKQSIFVKYTDISELREDQLQPHVPEIIRVDENSIEIIEEV